MVQKIYRTELPHRKPVTPYMMVGAIEGMAELKGSEFRGIRSVRVSHYMSRTVLEVTVDEEAPPLPPPVA